MQKVLPTPPEEWECGRTQPNSRATFQGLDQRSKMEELVPKLACWTSSDAGNSSR